MLFPENPKNRPSLWESLAEHLSSDGYCHVVAGCIGRPNDEAATRSADEIAAIVKSLREADICRLSASHGIVAAPHFGLQMMGTAAARLCELITFSSAGTTTASDERLQKDLETMIVSVFYDYPNIRELIVPIKLKPWKVIDAEVVEVEQGLRITRTATL